MREHPTYPSLRRRIRTMLAPALLAATLIPAAGVADDIFALEVEATEASSWSTSLSQRALPLAVQILVDATQPVSARHAAARLLDHAGSEALSQVPALMDNLTNMAPDDRWRIGPVFVRALEQERLSPGALQELAREHSDPGIRLFAVRVLSAGAETQSPARFAALMNDIVSADPDAQVRRAALRALELHSYESPEAIATFKRLLDTSATDQRLIAARGLERAGPAAADAVTHLLASLSAEDAHPAVREQLWRALVSAGADDPRVIGPDVPRARGADADDRRPGMRQRLSDTFQRRAEQTEHQADTDNAGAAYYSGSGWRSDRPALPAFPDAQGFGMWTPGGRGGEVLRVTHLGDSGPGSLRAAVEAEGPRIVIFDVAGVINLQDSLTITNPYITIAGQTAPGEGITIAGHHTHLGTHDAIVRHLRFRPGGSAPSGAKAINVRESDNVIVDQVSTSWAKEETLSVVESGRITVQRSFITHGLVNAGHPKGERGYGSLVRGAGPGRRDYAQGAYYSFINNLWAHQRSRAPRPGNYVNHRDDPVGPLFDFRNNVYYNWGGLNSGDNFDRESISRYNFVGNYFKPGPNSDGSYGFNEASPHARAFWSDNALDGEIPEDQWRLVRGETGGDYRQLEPFKTGLVHTDSALAAFERVLDESGAWPRDRYDDGVVEDVRTRGGQLIDDPSDVGGYPSVRPALTVVDTSGNGMPDWWQVKFGLAPAYPLPTNGDLNGSGYTNIEEYLNGTDMEAYIDPVGAHR
ncbi:HEAT repeat domain-containing protein [Marinimicrobium alkaliphilum]|uniref:HEAT repeat domain-containing protein n=1 Tax=Marinimicrobium alkaliphilum TaxID=2202654 RepID=UPI000DB928C9|nr:HEAT repeat domain-containing protein [Marinimicrobium alkaliphilum]